MHILSRKSISTNYGWIFYLYGVYLYIFTGYSCRFWSNIHALYTYLLLYLAVYVYKIQAKNFKHHNHNFVQQFNDDNQGNQTHKLLQTSTPGTISGGWWDKIKVVDTKISPW